VYSTRVTVAFALALDKALAKHLPYEVGRDVAQGVVIEHADNLFSEDWQEHICSRAFEHIKKAVKEYKKECKMLDKYKDKSEPWRRGCDTSRTIVREIAPEAMTPRQWQVCHRMYWHGLNLEDTGISLGISKQAVHTLPSRGLMEMGLAMRRLGVTKNTWYRWYYEGVL